MSMESMMFITFKRDDLDSLSIKWSDTCVFTLYRYNAFRVQVHSR